MISLPPLPDPQLLADICNECGAEEGVRPDLVEKDFYLTRLIWALGETCGEDLLLKGGTLLSKADLGFFRMSEDADFVMPGAKAGRGRNTVRLNKVRAAVKTVASAVGVTVAFPDGESFEKGAHRTWELRYESTFGEQRIQLEASLHPALLPPRQVMLKQLASDPLLGDYSAAACWALAEDEARAEKVRAASTREAIRDFYDLERLAELGKDFSSPEFITLVNAKLAELSAPLFEQQPAVFALTPKRIEDLNSAVSRELVSVLRADAPKFELAATIRRFETIWAGAHKKG